MSAKTLKIQPGVKIAITGYRGDGLARAVQVVEIKDGNLLVCTCLLRSSPIHQVYRTYRMNKIDGILPLVQNDGDTEVERPVRRKAVA